MKTLKCDLCEGTAQGETFEEWMRALQHLKRRKEKQVKSNLGDFHT